MGSVRAEAKSESPCPALCPYTVGTQERGVLNAFVSIWNMFFKVSLPVHTLERKARAPWQEHSSLLSSWATSLVTSEWGMDKLGRHRAGTLQPLLPLPPGTLASLVGYSHRLGYAEG